ncbi:hypothetical protein V8E54_005273 [Elaphomyces granulatus]
MPTAVLSNISTRLGIVNGALDKATGVVPDPAAKFYPMDSLYVLCTLPPKQHQVPVTPAWAITEYKAQGATSLLTYTGRALGVKMLLRTDTSPPMSN